MPLVSVVIPTYKRADDLLRAVRSALAQTLTDIEVIVVVEPDDAGARPALATVADPRVCTIMSPAKRGPAPARDLGANSATGRWIAFLDDDDEWAPEKLSRQIDLAGDARDVIVMTLSNVVMPAGTVVHPTMPYDGTQPIDEWLFGRRTWLKGGEAMLQTSSLMVPRALFGELEFGTARHEEWELVIRAVKQLGYRLLTVPEPLVTYYTGNTQYPWRPSVEWIQSMRDVVTPRAYAGFCLTSAMQGVQTPDRNLAALTFLRTAFRHGRPTGRQLFAFALIWLLPEKLRHALRIKLSRFRSGRGRPPAAVQS